MEVSARNHLCYACSEAITSLNQSFEHILPNAIGGRLKSKDLLCRTCNNEFGQKYESTFIEELRFFSGRLPLKRERGENQKFKTIDKKTNLPIYIDDHGKISLAHTVFLEKPDPINGGSFRVKAPNQYEADKIIDRYKEKYPLAKFQIETQNETNLESFVEVGGGIGSLSFFKTALKTMMNLFVFAGGSPEDVKIEASKLFFTDVEPRVWFLWDDQNRKEKLVHIVSVFGRPEEKILFGFLELFGGIRIIGVLNDNYSGPDINSAYAVDPIIGSNLDCTTDVNLTRSQILQIVGEKKLDNESFSRQLGLIESAIKGTHYFSNIISDVFQKTLFREENIGKDLTPELINEMTYELGEALMPNILAASKRRREEAEKEIEERQSKREKK